MWREEYPQLSLKLGQYWEPGECMQLWSKLFLVEDTYDLIYFLKNWIYNTGVLYKSMYLVHKHKHMKGMMLDTNF